MFPFRLINNKINFKLRYIIEKILKNKKFPKNFNLFNSRMFVPRRNKVAITRQPISHIAGHTACNKTKSALCFLCIFDGLRTPSVRRLVRKPRTICGKPLLTFDPTFFAPESENFVEKVYKERLNCTSEITIDPSAQSVLQLIRKNAMKNQTQRLLIHYFGHGCHPPLDDGSLFFFSDDHARYKPIRIANLLGVCPSPLAFIIDAPNAAVLTKYIATRTDVYAFFSTKSGETSPLSIDAPLDLFSSCLLTPYDTALWFHKRHQSTVLERDNNETIIEREEFVKFFDAILESIFFDLQDSSTYEKFNKDHALFELAKGFILAQRILSSFSIHPSSLPEIKPVASHDLWGFWDTSLDCALSMHADDVMDTIYQILCTTFDSFPTTSVFPLFSYLLTTRFQSDVSLRLLKFIDSVDGAASIAARSSLPNVIVDLEKPSAASLVILSKLIAVAKITPFTQQSIVSFTSSKDPGVLKAGMLSLCCSIAISSSSLISYNRAMQLCVEKATQCAPFSAILFGILLEKAGGLMKPLPFMDKFVPLLKSRKSVVRASVLFLLSKTTENGVLPSILPFLDDKDSFVRSQAALAIGKISQACDNEELFEKIKPLINDENEMVQKIANSLVNSEEQKSSNSSHKAERDLIIEMLVKSVCAPNFINRFEDELFL